MFGDEGLLWSIGEVKYNVGHMDSARAEKQSVTDLE